MLQGEGLLNVTGVKLEVLPAKVLEGPTDAQLKLRIDVPHGFTRGPASLKVSGASLPPGPHAEITAITVAASGNDVNGLGTPERPLLTLEGALAKHGGASSGDLIRIESDLILATTANFSIPDGVDLEGNGATLFGKNISEFIDVSGTHTIRNLSFDGFPLNALSSGVGQLTLIDVQFRNIGSSGLAFGNFVNVEASSTKPGGCLFEKSLNGVYVWGGSKAEQRGIFSAKGCTFRKMTGWGLIAEIGASLVLQDSLIEEAGTSGENAGIYLKNGAHGFLTGTTLRNNNPHNIYMLGQNGELQMDGGALEGGKAAFVWVHLSS
jgi:hypothetical protein